MNSSTYLSPFIEHSFRRLTLLIQQQDALDGRDIHSKHQSRYQTLSKSSAAVESSYRDNEDPSLMEFHLSDAQTNDFDGLSPSRRSLLTRTRIYMRPPKTRTISYRGTSNQYPDPSENSSGPSLNLSSSSGLIGDEIKRSIHERNLYNRQVEIDRRNDLREKYNIPPPFERQWLRQPRYVPQERPNFGQSRPTEDH